MNKTKMALLLFSLIFFVACGESTSETKFENDNETVTMKLSLGNDRTIEINSMTHIVANGSTSDGSILTYLWEKGTSTLATTATFDYMPTTLGRVDLTCTLQHISGRKIVSKLKLMVVESKEEQDVPLISNETINKYLKLVNDVRKKGQDCNDEGYFAATTPLTWNSKLYASSYEHSYDLAYSNTFSHDGSGTVYDLTGYSEGKKSSVRERVETHNYNWSHLGENIGAGTNIDTPEMIVQLWVESDHHCANIMNPNFKELGMVMVKKNDTEYIYYWTQNFGTKME